jgi:hypothetical protein
MLSPRFDSSFTAAYATSARVLLKLSSPRTEPTTWILLRENKFEPGKSEFGAAMADFVGPIELCGYIPPSIRRFAVADVASFEPSDEQTQI